MTVLDQASVLDRANTRRAGLTQMEAWLINVRCVGAVLGARQTGKTSLLLRLRHLLRAKYAFVFIDLEAVADADFADCVTYIASEMVGQLADQIDPANFVLPTKSNEFLWFLEKYARAVPTVRIVVLLDEIGALSPSTSLRLTSAIRAVFTSRHVKREFARYVFVVAGATDALEVATGRNSPLKNVAETLYLGDLSREETNQLVTEMFGESAAAADAGACRVMHAWTNGHPYWTQRLGSALHGRTGDLNEANVQAAVDQLLRTEDRNLPYVFHALDADRTLRDLTTAMVAGTPIAFSRANGTIARLELLGLLKNEHGRCAIRNRIYKEALHREPVRRTRQPARDLREYAERLNEAADVEAMLQAATLALQSIVQVRSVITLVPRARLGGFAVACSVGIAAEALTDETFSGDSQLLHTVTRATPLTDLVLPPKELSLVESLGATVVVPVRLKNTTAAFFCVGRRLSGDDYVAEDLEFFNAVADQTAAAIDRAQFRYLEREMKRAWETQRELLPVVLPRVDGIEVDGRCLPARVVSGDYYDAFMVNAHTMALCIGDVVGKGMPAALLMANLQATVKAFVSDSTSPNELCGSVNRVISRNFSPGEFITFFFALLDTTTHNISYTNAGHNPPIVVRANGEVVRLDAGGPVLGIFADQTYDHRMETLAAGDRLLLFTDGVIEARDAGDEEFGDDRLIELMRKSEDAATLCQSVIDTVERFCHGAFHDDVTVLAVTRPAAVASS
jgi:stage II sporulation SpoE-like protein/AAA domain-containing protein/GAF domain-containing protein